MNEELNTIWKLYSESKHNATNNLIRNDSETIDNIWHLYAESRSTDVITEARKVPDIYPRINHTFEKWDFAISANSFEDLKRQFYSSLDEDFGGGIHIDEASMDRLNDEIFDLGKDIKEDYIKEELIGLYGEKKYQKMLNSGKIKVFPIYEVSLDIEAINTQTNEPETMSIEFSYNQLTDWFFDTLDNPDEFPNLLLTYTFNEDSEFKERISSGSKTKGGFKRKEKEVDLPY